MLGTPGASDGGMSKDIQDRAFRFAVKVCTLQPDQEFMALVRRTVLRQLIDASTSVGANLEEASAAQSKADFIAKIAIAKKECRETQYWLRLGAASHVCDSPLWRDLQQEAEAIGRIVSAISRSARRTDGRGQ
jgi:four helix bundle protein